MSVDFDRASGLARAGGYSGHGVVASSLAGRTLADLITGTESDLADLPWVGHTSRRWEPEPLRFLGGADDRGRRGERGRGRGPDRSAGAADRARAALAARALRGVPRRSTGVGTSSADRGARDDGGADAVSAG